MFILSLIIVFAGWWLFTLLPTTISNFGSRLDPKLFLTGWGKVLAQNKFSLVDSALGASCLVKNNYERHGIYNLMLAGHDCVASASADTSTFEAGLFICLTRIKESGTDQRTDSQTYKNQLNASGETVDSDFGITTIKGLNGADRQIEWFKYWGQSYLEIMYRLRFSQDDTWVLNIQIPSRLSRRRRKEAKRLLAVMAVMIATLMPHETEGDGIN